MTSYKFNPLEHGFESISNYPELLKYFNADNFVKVVAYGDYGGLVYWYMVCNPFTHDDRIEFLGGAYDTREKASNSSGKREYCGLISNDEFARQLLMHLLGTTQTKSVDKEGVERYFQNLSPEIKSKFKR